MITAMERRHVDQVAGLHCGSLTGLLSRLGRRAVKAYYQGLVESPAATAYVFTSDGRVLGFVSGSADPPRLKKAVIQAKPWSVLVGLLLGTLRRPSVLRDLVSSLKPPPAGSYRPETPELTYLAVAAEARGSGVGRRLVEAFACGLSERGVDAFELSVDADNHGAVGFYERLGFTPIGQYREFSTLHRRYRLRLDATKDQFGGQRGGGG